MQDQLTIIGGRKLEGSVRVSGAKNAALPLIIATILSSEECVLKNVPDLEDTAVTIRLLRSLGAEAEFSENTLRIKTHRIVGDEAPYRLVKAMRASFWVLGPLLARYGSARVALPGGDAIGSRPVDLHLRGLVQLGADVRMKNGVVFATAPGGLKAQNLSLDFPSVGATHQLMMTAALIPGTTVIDGAAREPEVVELAALLSAMGADIEGAGTKRIIIRGRKELGGAEQEIEGDRIEAATFLLSGAVTGGRVTVRGITLEKLGAVVGVLQAAGCSVVGSDTSVSVGSDGSLRGVSFTTAPYPGVATDIQPLLMAALTRAEGTSAIEETIFDNRFGHVAEYRRLGANITLEGGLATVRGVKTLSGAPVEATDIRAAVGLVIMGLMADGVTEVNETHHLDRGYENFVEKLTSLGANASRVPTMDRKELTYGC